MSGPVNKGAVPAEPVAWAFEHSDGRITYHGALESMTAYRDTCVRQWPLYESAPPAAPAPAPQPLTGDQVFASEDFMAANGLYWGLSLDTLMQIIRVTERAHGITGGATGGSK